MLVSGVHARVTGGRHSVGLVVIDTAVDACLGHFHWVAPAGEDAAGQLHELYVRAHELFERTKAEALVTWTTEPAPGGTGRRAQLIDSSRAEGCVMAAAGAVAGLTTIAKAGNAVVRSVGGRGSTADAVAALGSGISGLGNDEPVLRAAAAAIAWANRN